MSPPKHILFVKICINAEGTRYVHCFCEKIDRRETNTILKNAQIPFLTWSADGKRLTLTGKKIDVRQFSHSSVGIFAFPRARPSWFVLS